MLEVFPQADLVVGVLAPSLREHNGVTRRARETWLGKLPLARKHHRWFLPLEGLAFASVNTMTYDLVISSSHAFAKMVRPRPGALHVCYCYSPPRYLWDLRETYKSDATALQYLALVGMSGVLRWMDVRAAKRVNQFVAISQCVSARIQRCYGRHAEVIYPPVQAKAGRKPAAKRGSFFLYLGRLVPYKRVDLAIAAARQLGVELVIAGSGPDSQRLQDLSGDRVRFLGEVDEAEAAHLLDTCAAFVFCGEEDFGIAPLEANAHGAPVVYFARGGVAETMIAQRTGVPFYRHDPADVVDAMRRILDMTWSPSELAQNAERYSPRRFRDQFAQLVQSQLATK